MPKLWLALGTVGSIVFATAAAAQDEAAFRTAMMARCATIGDKSARLACYDAAQRSGPVAMPPAASGGGSAPVAAYAPAPRASGDAFGRDAQRAARRNESSEPKQVRARAIAATADGAGYWKIQLDNGATWKLAERDELFRPPSKNDTVRIRKGALGSYLMDVDHQPSVRVVRVD